MCYASTAHHKAVPHITRQYAMSVPHITRSYTMSVPHITRSFAVSVPQIGCAVSVAYHIVTLEAVRYVSTAHRWADTECPIRYVSTANRTATLGRSKRGEGAPEGEARGRGRGRGGPPVHVLVYNGGVLPPQLQHLLPPLSQPLPLSRAPPSHLPPLPLIALPYLPLSTTPFLSASPFLSQLPHFAPSSQLRGQRHIQFQPTVCTAGGQPTRARESGGRRRKAGKEEG
eukprot:915605-Rhodomonas_salina.1